MACSNAMAPVTLIGSPQKAFTSHSCSSSFTSASVALANSRFHHRPNPAQRPNSKLEAAYYKADNAIQDIVALLAAASYLSHQILKYFYFPSPVQEFNALSFRTQSPREREHAA